ncbi:hypothetical protein [Butyrivibrio sp. VCD2006]|uniref:hypothetical protein n=1 Tax=Butyrivibrio sp. VCD2006 TaxID=1280664 RepID=UPI001FA790AA|nr:hypothetical protein [Butyrivibrio sp. VCD2006]
MPIGIIIFSSGDSFPRIALIFDRKKLVYLKYPRRMRFPTIPKVKSTPENSSFFNMSLDMKYVKRQEISSVTTKSNEKSPYKTKEAAISEISASFLFSIRLNPYHKISTMGKNIKMNENELNDMV